jgi:hypothetical protein
MEFHEATAVFLLDEEHLGELAGNIRDHGLQVPIEVFEGKIIDGRRRYLACHAAGVSPKYRDVQVDNPVAYVLSKNVHRRHLSPTQLGMCAARVLALYDREAKERQKRKPKDSGPAAFPERNKGPERDLVGKLFGISDKTVDHATKVLERGTPKLVAAADAGLIAVSSAAKYASYSEAEQDAVAGRAAEKAKAGRAGSGGGR